MMHCPWCRKALPLKTFLVPGRRKSSVRCRRCSGLARYEGHAPWYGPALLTVSAAYFIVSTELPKVGIASSSWLRLALLVLAVWLADWLSRRFVAVGPDPAR